MRVQIYVIKVCGSWQARMTIHAEVDKHFWMDGLYGGSGRLNSDVAEAGWLLQEGMPLGDACLAVECWETAYSSKRLKTVIAERNKLAVERVDKLDHLNKFAAVFRNNGGSSVDDREAAELLIACVEQVKRQVEQEKADAGRRRWLQFGGRSKRQIKLGAERLMSLVERWERVAEGSEAGRRTWMEGAESREAMSGMRMEGAESGEAMSGMRMEVAEGSEAGRGMQMEGVESREAMSGTRMEGAEGREAMSGMRMEGATSREAMRGMRMEGAEGREAMSGMRMEGAESGEAMRGTRMEGATSREAMRGMRMEGAVRDEAERQMRVKRAELERIAAGAKRAAAMVQGRALLRSEAHALLSGAGSPGAAADWSAMLQLAALLGLVRLSGSIAAENGGQSGALGRRRRERRCLRCGSGEASQHRTACASCGRICAYCTACLGMGRSRECELLVTGQRSGLSGAEPCDAMMGKLPPIEQRLRKWQLSPAQTAAAVKALTFVEEAYTNGPHLPRGEPSSPREFLLWAVTGAGKTEMIFPLVEAVLLRGGKALIATPRRDVVIELDPRIRKAFPSAAVVTLYGGSEQRWESGDITLATTHQLLRFYQGFDLVVVDELDAFPFAGDPLLHYAADKSCAPGAARLLLSATPPSELQRAAKRGKLPHARVPVRYHRHPLPVPKLLQTPAVKQMLQQRKLPPKLLSALRTSLARGAQLFVFVQQIAQTEAMAALLRAALPCLAVAATSSQDAERADKVLRFRARDIRVLVTTTILERGVTIPKSDVYILDADGRLFDEASLVQMAGRAGRSADDPFGHVYFCSRERNRPQQQAVSHIRTMNRIARKQGYLLPSGKGGSHR
ncbi:DEAD/DEAH box helicase [Paenibacillus sinopodophylli]|uniref:DEAD/DEAH box helicase n=1 Tax=Paenibacillus sinopodophylli TaxID=1837342 RepID=UPI001FE61856|nr:helicase-related protein [Paenibacillus sinopodophylli]